MDESILPVSSPLLQNLLLFVRLLRRVGLRVTTGGLIDLTASLEVVDIADREDFKNAARAILVNRHEDVELFDRAFDVFWRAWSPEQREAPPESILEELVRQALENGDHRAGRESARSTPALDRLASGSAVPAAGDEDEEDEILLATYSPGEILRSKDFSLLSETELADAKRFLREMRWDLTRRRSRRLRHARRGRRLDVRRSIRLSLRHGGEILELSYRGPKLKRRQLVVLCDISGSMERYSRLLLHFLHAVGHNLENVEVFLFGTRLTRITPALRRRDPDAALAAVGTHVEDWSGGTRIGDSLHTFNRRWARRVLEHGAIVMIISDGWDRGDPGVLAVEMERLQRASYRLIWLNPLLGAENYRPLTQGILAALPYVDDFLPVHNLQSLESLAALLNGLRIVRPERKQVRRTATVAS